MFLCAPEFLWRIARCANLKRQSDGQTRRGCFSKGRANAGLKPHPDARPHFCASESKPKPVGPAGGYGYPVARQRAAVKKPESGRLRSCIYGRAQSAKRLSGLAEGAIRAPHVFRSGFARRRAFPVTGRYGGRAGYKTGCAGKLRERAIRSGGIRRVDQQIVIPFTNRDSAEKARAALSSDISELQWQISKAD